MVSGALFATVDAIARAVLRQPDRPFAGLQVLLFGDFLGWGQPTDDGSPQRAQLPPVTTDGRRDYAFDTRAWAELGIAVCELTALHRQSSDPEFGNLLREARMGCLSCDAYLLLRGRDGVPPAEGAVRLRSRNRDVERENASLFDRLPGTVREYDAVDAGPELQRLAACAVPERVVLKVGARVILLANLLAADLANGDCGTVLGFEHASYDIRLGLHSSRTLSEAVPVVQFDRTGEKRTIRRTEWWISRPLDPTEIPADVQAALHTSDAFRTPAEARRIEQWRGGEARECGLLARRWQVPLRLAWAMTVHRSQGLTLHAVDIDAHGVFESGQLYVALSRARTLSSIALRNFRRSGIRADPLAVAYYRSVAAERVPFGRHEGVRLSELHVRDPAYVRRWLADVDDECAAGLRRWAGLPAVLRALTIRCDGSEADARRILDEVERHSRPPVSPAGVAAAAALVHRQPFWGSGNLDADEEGSCAGGLSGAHVFLWAWHADMVEKARDLLGAAAAPR